MPTRSNSCNPPHELPAVQIRKLWQKRIGGLEEACLDLEKYCKLILRRTLPSTNGLLLGDTRSCPVR